MVSSEILAAFYNWSSQKILPIRRGLGLTKFVTRHQNFAFAYHLFFHTHQRSKQSDFFPLLQSPDRPYQCGHCPSSFPGPAELREHVVIHINEKPFKCGFCGRSFAGATTLNNHIRTHTGEKPFKCDKCHKTFSQSTQLSRHQKSPEECQRDVIERKWTTTTKSAPSAI